MSRRYLALAVPAAAALLISLLAPVARASAPAPPTLLVTDGNDGLVAALNPANGAVERRMQVGTAPTAVAVAGGYLFSADYRSATVTRIDQATGEALRVPVGAGPSALAVCDGFVWVADSEADQVVPVAVATGQAGRPIPVPAGPVAIVASPTGSAMYVVSSTTGTLSTIDTSSRRVVSSVAVGNLPQGVAVSADGSTAYVTVQSRIPGTYNDAFPIGGGSSPADPAIDDGSLAEVDLATGKLTSTVEVGLDPEGVAIDGPTAFVANAGDGTVTPVALSSGLVGAPITVGDGPQQLLVDAAAGTLDVSLAGSGAVARIALPSRRLLPPMQVGGEPLGMALTSSVPKPAPAPLVCSVVAHTPSLLRIGSVEPAAQAPSSGPWRIFATNAGGSSVTEVDVATGRDVATIPVGNKPSAAAVAPDGRTAYIDDFGDNAVTPIDVATGKQKAEIPVGGNPNAIAIAPDGSEALVTDYDSNAVTPIRLADDRPLPSLPVGGGPSSIAITPDGAMAFLVDSDTDAVTPIDVLTNTVWSQIPVGYNPQGIAIGPDGGTAWVTNAGYVRNADSGSVTPIDTVTLRPGPGIPVGRYPVYPVVTVDGAIVYAPNSNSGTVTPISTATRQALPAIPAGSGPDALGASPDGSTVYAVDLLGAFPAGTLTPINTSSRTPGKTIPVGYGPIAIGVSPGYGYYTVNAAGAVAGNGAARRLGGQVAPEPGSSTSSVVGAAEDPLNGAVWVLRSDGSVGSWRAPDDAASSGYVAGQRAAAIAALADGTGYRVATSAGRVLLVSGGRVRVQSAASPARSSPVIGMATDTCTGGYWLLHSDGSVTGVAAPVYGHPVAVTPVGIAVAQDGRGYWIATADGRVFGYGSAAGVWRVGLPLKAVATGPPTGGFWALTTSGTVVGVGAPVYPGSAIGAVALVPGPDSTPR